MDYYWKKGIELLNLIKKLSSNPISIHFFSCAFVFCSLMFSAPLFRWLVYDGHCACFFIFSLFSLSLVPVSGSYWCRELVASLLCKTILKVSYLIIILWSSLEKETCFDSNYSLGCVYPTLYVIRLLGWVYFFSLLICYPSSSWTQI